MFPLIFITRNFKRLPDKHLQAVPGKVIVEIPLIYEDGAAAFLHVHPRDSVFPSAGSIVAFFRHHVSSS